MPPTPYYDKHYFVPQPSRWPITGSLGLACLMLGFANLLHGHLLGHYFFFFGSLCLAYTMFGWFSDVIRESSQYNQQVDRSFRWGMAWFIFSEIMFFAAFFGALFYARCLSVPWLAGEGDKASTHLLWPQFKAIWPLLKNPDPALFKGPHDAMEAWGIPALNTLILLTSGVTITIAHYNGLVKKNRILLNIFLFFTILLGSLFLSLQAYEYWLAYDHYRLTLSSGIYGSTFFMLTGFHGAHVTMGTIMLIVMLLRCLRGHFTPEHHFAFEAVAWYWHFVDAVWLALFVFVYWL